MSQDQEQIERLRLAIAEAEHKANHPAITQEQRDALMQDVASMRMLLDALETAVNPIIPEGEQI